MRVLRLLIISSFLALSPPIYIQLSLGAESQQGTLPAAVKETSSFTVWKYCCQTERDILDIF